MTLKEFVRKQFIDVIEWFEPGDDTLAWRYPMRDQEIQNGASLTVREAQLALFVDEGRVADVFGPGRHRLATQTLPLLTNLRHWDKLFASPFKSDVYFFSTRLQLDRRWGTAQPISIRDRDFGAVRLRAHGNFGYRIGDARRFHTEVAGTREHCGATDLDGQLRALLLQHMTDAVANSGMPFLDLASNLVAFAQQLQLAAAPDFERLGLRLEQVTLQSVSLPEELEKLLDQRIGMSMVGADMNRFVQYQAAQSLTTPGNGGGMTGDAVGLGAGVAIGQSLAQQLQQASGAVPASMGPDAVMATLEKLAELKSRGIVTEQEFDAKKTELLRKLG